MRDAPLRIGMTVHVPATMSIMYQPKIEGLATLVAPMPYAPDVWRVRFVGEDMTRIRLVHPGPWQRSPERIIAALQLHWRATLDPSLLASFPELPPG